MEWFAGRVEEYEEGDRKIATAGDTEVCILRKNNQFYAYENVCLHQGGPACEGLMLGKVEPVYTGDKGVTAEVFSEEEIHFVCPWHGWEYDTRTGECAADRKQGLKRYEVMTRGNELYVMDK